MKLGMNDMRLQSESVDFE